MNISKYAKIAFAILLISSSTYSQWYNQISGTSMQLYSIYFINQNTGFIAGDSGQVLMTTNGGQNWTKNVVINSNVGYNKIFFVNPSTGYISGSILFIDTQGVHAIPKIIKTTTGGANWFSILNDSGFTIRSVYFINPNTGFASGGLFANGPNYLETTTNSGASWQRTSPGEFYMNCIAFKDAFTGYITTYNGHLYRTTDSGNNWTINTNEPAYVLTSLFFVDANLGFLAGGNFVGADSSGQVYKSTNGGTNWSLVYYDHHGLLNDIKFVSSEIGFAAGTFDNTYENTIPGRIIKTTNSGIGWFTDTTFSNVFGLTSLFFTDPMTGYAVGGNGVILKTTTGGNPIGIFPISIDVPKQFSLSQNYPNPFNPVTTIKFNVPKESYVKVSLFDILGNEVQSLVDENLKAGEYKVTWDGTKYSSGIYFYKLQTDDFTDTKKLVLLK